MTKDELIRTINADKEYHMIEFGLSEEEARNIVKENYVLNYIYGDIDEEEFLGLINEMGYEVENMKALRDERESRKIRLEIRKYMEAK